MSVVDEIVKAFKRYCEALNLDCEVSDKHRYGFCVRCVKVDGKHKPKIRLNPNKLDEYVELVSKYGFDVEDVVLTTIMHEVKHCELHDRVLRECPNLYTSFLEKAICEDLILHYEEVVKKGNVVEDRKFDIVCNKFNELENLFMMYPQELQAFLSTYLLCILLDKDKTIQAIFDKYGEHKMPQILRGIAEKLREFVEKRDICGCITNLKRLIRETELL